MGCAGSKPHLLLSSTLNNHHHHHSNSPQKGFILFNAKTIEFLKANEIEIKAKLVQRCEQKLLSGKSIPQSSSSKSLLSNAKKTLLMNTNNNNNNNNNNNTMNSSSTTNNLDESFKSGTGASNTLNGGVKSNKSDMSLAHLTTSLSNTSCSIDPIRSKQAAIDSAVDYVLKYAINDFDIDNFRSSNHLSMKQIRKDIMKKNNGRQSFSRLNNSIATNSSTLNSKDSSTLPAKACDLSFYKLSLNTAIDEFGSFIQENFIVINEFEPKAENVEKPVVEIKNETIIENPVIIEEAKQDEEKEEQEIKEVIDNKAAEDEEALKLKEALELARQNFYKGKMSMVCLTKTGGYVVKEVQDKDQTSDNLAANTSGNNISAGMADQQSEDKEKVLTLLDTQTQQTSQVTLSAQINVQDSDIESNLKIIDSKSPQEPEQQPIKRLSLTNFRNVNEQMAINRLQNARDELVKILNETIESIVNYSTKSNEKTADNNVEQQLKDNLIKSKNTIELLGAVNESYYSHIDEKIIENTVNLDYVNREFKTYLKIYEDNILKKQENMDKGMSDIRKNVESIHRLISNLPKRLFSSKGYPHPSDVNQSNPSTMATSPNSTNAQSSIVDAAIADQLKIKLLEAKNKQINEETQKSPKSTPEKKTVKIEALIDETDNDVNNTKTVPIDIKKEIAFSILNVGEVIAKTLDYYSLDPNDGQADELKELIMISEKQAAHERQLFESRTRIKSKSDTDEIKNNSKTAEQDDLLLQVDNNKIDENVSVQPPSVVIISSTDEIIDNKTTDNKHQDQPQLSENQQQQQQTTNVEISGSSASSLSSPSLSTTSSLSASGSVSPVIVTQDKQMIDEQQQQHHEKEDDQTSNNNTNILRKESIQDDIAYLVQEMSLNMNTQINYLDAFERQQAKRDNQELINNHHHHQHEEDEYEVIQHLVNSTVVLDRNNEIDENCANDRIKSSSSSSDVLSTNNDDHNHNHSESQLLVQNYITNIIENATQRYSTTQEEQIEQVIAQQQDNQQEYDQQQQQTSTVVFRNSVNCTTTTTNVGNNKRMSLDEEFLYQLEEVDKKVKYMNETCSENEDSDMDDDDDLDDENFDYDESVELENTNDERLFHPRTPAKIKSEVRQNRTVDLHEEIKQISNVIQDLVQTINVRNGSNDGSVNCINVLDNTDNNCVQNVISSCEDNNSDNNNADSEDGGCSHNSSSGGDYSKSKMNRIHLTPTTTSKNSASSVERKISNSSRRSAANANNNSFNNSNIPIRQKLLTKQRATSIEDENANNSIVNTTIESESFKTTTVTPSTNFESFVDFSALRPAATSTKSENGNHTPTMTSYNNSQINKSGSASSNKFRSKLPVSKNKI